MGFRILAYIPNRGFVSPYVDYHWQKGVNTAICSTTHFVHMPPQIDCECGFYAFHDFNDAFNHLSDFRNDSKEYVLAGCIGWGDNSLIHTDRWRTRFMEIVSIFDSQERSMARSAGKFFSVPLLPRQDLERNLWEHGDTRYKEFIPPGRLETTPWENWTRKDVQVLIQKIQKFRFELWVENPQCRPIDETQQIKMAEIARQLGFRFCGQNQSTLATELYCWEEDLKHFVNSRYPPPQAPSHEGPSSSLERFKQRVLFLRSEN